MDHLPLPANADPPKIQVPFICGTLPTTVAEFLAYPSTHELTIDQDGIINVADLFQMSLESQLSFTQSWLYFSPLRLVCGPGFLVNDFGRLSENGAAVLCTTSLPTYCQEVHKWLLQSDPDENLLECLVLAQRNFAVINQDNNFTRQSPFSALLFSIRILYDYLWNSDRSFMPPKVHINITSSPDNPSNSLPSASLLRKHMEDRGWCYHELNNLQSYVPLDTLYFIGSLPRRSSRTAGHGSCSSFTNCIAYNTGDQANSGHATQNCTCAYLTPSSPEDLHSIISRGRIPLLSFTESATGVISLSYVEATPTTSYTAISHLWADGLGNQNSNSMLLCQFQKLTNQIRNLSGILKPNSGQNLADHAQQRLRRILQNVEQTLFTKPLLFWIDVFCIPVGQDAESLDLKAKAISRMTPTYASADWVLVLDGELEEIPSKVSYEEMLARLLISSWNTRYWTAQEFSLSRRRAVQFQDGPQQWIDVKTSARAVQCYKNIERSIISPKDRLFSSLAQIMPQGIPTNVGFYLEYEQQDDSRCIQFATVWNNLIGRTSSKAQDLHCVMANLLDFSAKEILALPAHQRTKAIIRSHKTIPMGILFCSIPYSSQLPKDGKSQLDRGENRWVPELPSGPPLPPMRYGSQAIALVQDDGLLLHTGLFSDGQLRCLEVKFEENKRPYRFILNVDNRQWWVELRCPFDDPGPSVQEGRALLLVQAPLKTPRVSGRGYLGYGALVYSTDSTSKTLHTTYDCPVTYGLFKGVCTEPQFATACSARYLGELKGYDVLISSSIASWPKLKFRRPINFTSYRRKHFVSRLIFIFLVYVVIILFFLTSFIGDILPHAVFFSVIGVASFIALWFYWYGNFQVWWRSALYLESFDDMYDLSEPWAVKVKRLLNKQRSQKPLGFVVFSILLALVEFAHWARISSWKTGEEVGSSPWEREDSMVDLRTLRRDGSVCES